MRGPVRALGLLRGEEGWRRGGEEGEGQRTLAGSLQFVLLLAGTVPARVGKSAQGGSGLLSPLSALCMSRGLVGAVFRDGQRWVLSICVVVSLGSTFCATKVTVVKACLPYRQSKACWSSKSGLAFDPFTNDLSPAPYTCDYFYTECGDNLH